MPNKAPNDAVLPTGSMKHSIIHQQQVCNVFLPEWCSGKTQQIAANVVLCTVCVNVTETNRQQWTASVCFQYRL